MKERQWWKQTWTNGSVETVGRYVVKCTPRTWVREFLVSGFQFLVYSASLRGLTSFVLWFPFNSTSFRVPALLVLWFTSLCGLADVSDGYRVPQLDFSHLNANGAARYSRYSFFQKRLPMPTLPPAFAHI